MIIWFASGNMDKKRELEGILAEKGEHWEIKTPSEAGIDFEPLETGKSFLENAIIKAEYLYRLLEESKASDKCRSNLLHESSLIIADDSGICVDALDGRPGIHSARYAGAKNLNKDGINLKAAERNALLLEELGANPLRNARFVCAMVLYCDPNRFFSAQETLEGELVQNIEAARGTGGHGYDPIFLIPELGLTAAELSEDDKNRISHRGKAGRAIAFLIHSLLNESTTPP